MREALYSRYISSSDAFLLIIVPLQLECSVESTCGSKYSATAVQLYWSSCSFTAYSIRERVLDRFAAIGTGACSRISSSTNMLEASWAWVHHM